MNNKLIKKIENFILYIGREYKVVELEDFKQDIFILLLQKGEDFIIQLDKENSIKKYVYKVCIYQIISERGNYRTKYYIPSHFSSIDEVETYYNSCFKDEVLNDLINSLEGLDKIMLEHLLLCSGNKQCLSKKSKIHYNTIQYKFKELANKIKSKWSLNEFYT